MSPADPASPPSDDVAVSSPFANARADAGAFSAQERLEAAAATQRPGSASMATGDVRAIDGGLVDGESSSPGLPTVATEAVVRDDLDRAGAASPAPDGAMTVHPRADATPSDCGHAGRDRLGKRAILVAEAMLALLVIAVALSAWATLG